MADYLDEPVRIQRARIVGTLIGAFLPPLWPLTRSQDETLQVMLQDIVSQIHTMQITVADWRRERRGEDSD